MRSWLYHRTSSLGRAVSSAGEALSRVSPNGLVLALASMVGVGAGFAAVGFGMLLSFSHDLFFETLGRLQASGSSYGFLFLPLVPAIGGLIVGPLIYKFAREAKGHGVPEVMEAVASRGGLIRRRLVFVKALASAICIGSGGSAGREGPIVQIGSALGTVFGCFFQVSPDRMKVLVGCGAAGGISATFNAPIGGVLFALEVILGDFRVQTFSPVVISAVLASVVAQSIIGSDPAFSVPTYELVAPWELVNYLVLGALCGVAAVAFSKVLYALEDRFDRLPVKEWLRPAFGGLAVGCLGLVAPQIMGVGYPSVSAALHGQMLAPTLALLVVLKLLATSLTLGSGGSGGVFAPSLFIGAMLGGLFGAGVEAVFPELALQSTSGTSLAGAYALVGMGAVVAASTHAWMASAVIVFEMTDNYSIILPLMFATIVGMLVSRALASESIYTMKLARTGRHVGRGLDLALLSRLRVSDAMFTNYVYLRPASPLREVIRTARRARSYDFPVVTDENRLVGMIGLPDVALAAPTVAPDLLVASDFATTRYSPLFPDEDLESAMAKFDSYDRPTLPVVSADDPDVIVGMLDRRQILNLHERTALLHRFEHDDEAASPWQQTR